MKTQEVLLNGRIYLASDYHDIHKRFSDILGPNIDEWYKVSEQRLEEGGWKDENMFLTGQRIVRSIVTASRVTFIVYKRTDLIKFEEYFNVIAGRAELLKLDLTLREHDDFELPRPSKDLVDYREQHTKYINFINKLIRA